MTAHSHSSRQEFLSCERKWYHNRIERIEPVHDAPALRMGRAFALCLEEGFEGAADRDYDEAIGSAKSREAADGMRLEQAQVQVLARQYRAFFGMHRSEIRERAFTHPLLGEGRIDAILPHPDPDVHWVYGVEDKLLTRAFWRECHERWLGIDAQTTAYFAAMRDAGTPMINMQRRVTFKPTIKPDGRRKESLADYSHRLEQRIIDDPAYAFKHYIICRNDEQMDAFMERVERVNKRINAAVRASRTQGEKAFVQNLGESCTAYSGCAFLARCTRELGHDVMYRPRTERPKLSPIQRSTLLALLDSFTSSVGVADAARQVGEAESKVRYALDALVTKGLAVKTKESGRVSFAATPAGRALR